MFAKIAIRTAKPVKDLQVLIAQVVTMKNFIFLFLVELNVQMVIILTLLLKLARTVHYIAVIVLIFQLANNALMNHT
jgi:hypothetical protein